MDSLRIEPVNENDIKLDITCKCGKVISMFSFDGGHPSFCGSCETAYYIKSHNGHYHINMKSISRNEMLQYSYGRLQVN